MKGTFKVTNISGIPLRVHWTFFLLFLWLLFSGFNSNWQLEWLHIGKLTLFLVALFSCVVLHELGHALVARHYGIKTHSIVLLPVGGAALMEENLFAPKKEFFISIAGPLVNFGIAILLLPFLFMINASTVEQLFIFISHLDTRPVLSNQISFSQVFVFFMIMLNVIIGVFNLLPVLPLDGGRILRAVLSTRLGRQSATKKVITIGIGFSVIFVLIGILKANWLIAFFGIYIFITAFKSRQEYFCA